MNQTIKIALVLSSELILQILVLYVIYWYSYWEREQASVNAAPSSFDIGDSEQEPDEEAPTSVEQPQLVEEGAPTEVVIVSPPKLKKKAFTFSDQQSAACRAAVAWLAATSLVTDWAIFLFIGILLLLAERYFSARKHGRLADWQLSVYIFSMFTFFALLVTTQALFCYSCHKFFGEFQLLGIVFWGEDATIRYRNVFLGYAIVSVLSGLVTFSACSSGHGPSQFASLEDLDNCTSDRDFVSMA